MRKVTKKTWFTRITCAVLIGCMALGMTACGGSDSKLNNGSASSNAAKNAVFHEESIDLMLDYPIQSINQLTKAGDRIYGLATSYENYIDTTYLLSFLTDGTDPQYTVLQTVDNSRYYQDDMIAYPETAIEDLISSTLPVEEPSESEQESSENEQESSESEQEPSENEISGETEPSGNSDYEEEVYTSSWYNGLSSDQSYLYLLENSYTSSSAGYSESYSLTCLNLDGSQRWSVELGKNGDDMLTSFYAGSMLGLDDGVLLRTDQDGETIIAVYDSEGNLLSSRPVEVGYPDTFLRTAKGDILMQYSSETDWSQWIAVYDPETGAVGEPFQIPGVNQWNYNLNTNVYGGSYDLYYTSNQSLYGYTMGAEASVEIMNLIDSDIDSNYMQSLLILDDENLLMTQYDYEANNYEGAFYLSSLTKVAPEDVVDKIILQLACYNGMYNIRTDVIDFNKNNDTYRIKIIDYSTYNTEDDWNAGLTRLNSDIVSGNAPDIIYLNGSMPVSSFINKGVLADLYPFIDKDPDLNREDFLGNILDAFSVDGKLYQMVPSFDLMTLAAKSKLVGEESGWTVHEMIDFAKNADPDAMLFESVTAVDLLTMFINYSGDEWIDWEKGTCDFNSDSFIELLEFSATLPQDYSVYEELWNSEDYWSTYESMYREERTLLNYFYLYNFRGYQRLKYATFGEDITLIGYPMTNGNGAVISYGMSMAISSSCKNPDGAWSFIRQYLMEDYQSTITNDWPVTVKQMDVLKEQAKQKPYYEDMDGNKIEYDDTYWVGDQEVIIPVMSDEEVAAVYDVISNASTTYYYDSSLMSIITEEVEAFYSGQKTAAAVADIIQSRASIYISENQ